MHLTPHLDPSTIAPNQSDAAARTCLDGMHIRDKSGACHLKSSFFLSVSLTPISAATIKKAIIEKSSYAMQLLSTATVVAALTAVVATAQQAPPFPAPGGPQDMLNGPNVNLPNGNFPRNNFPGNAPPGANLPLGADRNINDLNFPLLTNASDSSTALVTTPEDVLSIPANEKAPLPPSAPTTTTTTTTATQVGGANNNNNGTTPGANTHPAAIGGANTGATTGTTGTTATTTAAAAPLEMFQCMGLAEAARCMNSVMPCKPSDTKCECFHFKHMMDTCFPERLVLSKCGRPGVLQRANYTAIAASKCAAILKADANANNNKTNNATNNVPAADVDSSAAVSQQVVSGLGSLFAIAGVFLLC